jgi:hypothetical protein
LKNSQLTCGETYAYFGDRTPPKAFAATLLSSRRANSGRVSITYDATKPLRLTALGYRT